MKKIIAGLISIGAMAGNSFAASVNWDGSSSGNFNEGSNWSGESVPGAGDTAFIRNETNNPVFQNAQDRTFDRLSMGLNGSASSLWRLDINGGSINTTSGPNNIGQHTAGTVVLNVQGGAFTAQGEIVAGGGGGDTFINLSSGSLSVASANIGSNTGNATLNIIGDAALSATGGGFTFGSNGTLSFEFNATGVKTLSLGSLTAASGTLAVDLTGYTGTYTTITLADVTGGSGISSAFGTVNVTEGAYAGSFVTQDLGNDVITLTIVPESGCYALIGGLLALGSVMLRRRRA